MRAVALALTLPSLLLAVLAGGCQTTTQVAFVNPSEQPLFVQINERQAFEVSPGASVKANVPALDRLTPITITARDANGRTIFFVTTSLPRLEASGKRVELKASGQPVDPLLGPQLAVP